MTRYNTAKASVPRTKSVDDELMVIILPTLNESATLQERYYIIPVEPTCVYNKEASHRFEFAVLD
jgi:hypothetical protein